MIQKLEFDKRLLLPILGAIVFYLLFAYHLERTEFPRLLLLYTGLFFTAWKLLPNATQNFGLLVVVGVLFRVLFLPAIPNLSQDFYRFLWDGQIVAALQNPYLFTPQEYMNFVGNPVEKYGVQIANSHELHAGMGGLNASHFSNYPPANQFFFALASLFGGKTIVGGVIVLRVCIIAAEVGIVYFGKKLLEHLKIPSTAIFWYFLNPFIIIELTGNLHFEGVMLFFLMASLYLLHKQRWIWAAIMMALSISVKLLPLMLLPFCFYWFGNKNRNYLTSIFRSIPFYLLMAIVVGITFLPFLSEVFLQNFSKTIALWFQNFEFNASVYYVIRWIGFQTVGWNIIGTVGKILPLIVIAAILVLTFFRKNNTTKLRITAMLFAVTIYFLLSTTVHPWYLATPVLLSVFTNYKFPIMWSFFIILSYSAYHAEGFQENLWLVAVEYVVVISFAITEILSNSGEQRGNFRILRRSS